MAQRGERSPSIEEMADVRAVDHHPAKEHELGQRWTHFGEVAAQNGRVERHRLEHPPRQGGALQRRPVVRMMRIGAQSNRSVVLQEGDHLGSRGEEGAHSGLVESVAENGPQIAPRVFGAVAARRAVAGVGHPHRAGRTGARATYNIGLLDQLYIETEHGCRQRSRHAGSAAAEDKQVDMPFARHGIGAACRYLSGATLNK